MPWGDFMLSPRAPEEQGTTGKDQHFAQEGADEFSIAREGRYQRVDAKVRPFVAGNHGAQERQVDEGEARQLLVAGGELVIAIVGPYATDPFKSWEVARVVYIIEFAALAVWLGRAPGAK